jgi:hypothetical protein
MLMMIMMMMMMIVIKVMIGYKKYISKYLYIF